MSDLPTSARVVIIGGGAVGASCAYHLAKAGWTDFVLLEKNELTAGSTWHAAGLLPYFNMSYATTHIHDYSIKYYKTLQEETGLDAGFYVVGNLRMAQSSARMDEYMLYATTAETCGVPFEWMTPAQIKERWPLVIAASMLATAGLDNAQSQRLGDSNEFLVRTQDFEGIVDTVTCLLEETYGPDGYSLSADAVGPKVGSELQRKALIAILMVGLALLILHFQPRTRITMTLAGAIIGQRIAEGRG